MRIALDARWIFDEISGIGSYTRELIRNLAQIDRENDYLLLFEHVHLMDRTAAETHFNAAPNFQAKILPYGVFSLRSQVMLPWFLEEHDVKLYHSPNFMIPLRSFPRHRPGHPRCVTTIHDVIPLLFPDHAPKSRKSRFFPVYVRLMKEAAIRTDVIISVSESSRHDLIRQLQIPIAQQDRVVAIPNGVNSAYFPLPRPREPGPPTILYVGRFDPYKNVVTLVEAYARLRESGIDARLRIIGPPDIRYPEPQARARELGVYDEIDWSGYVHHDQLIEAYRRAHLFVLPSRYEGFGLPVLEAMAFGTPVVCSNASSLPEVAGDAALLVPPGDVEELTRAMVQVLTHPGLAQDLRARGLQRVREFTWESTVRKTLDTYRRAASL